MPALVAEFGLKTGGGRFSNLSRVIVTPQFEIAVDGRNGQSADWRLHFTVRRVHPEAFQKLNGSNGRDVPPFFVKGADFEGGDHFAVTLHPGDGQFTRFAQVGAVSFAGMVPPAQSAVESVGGDSEQIGGGGDQSAAFGTANGQRVEPLLEADQSFRRNLPGTIHLPLSFVVFLDLGLGNFSNYCSTKNIL